MLIACLYYYRISTFNIFFSVRPSINLNSNVLLPGMQDAKENFI